jgi:hypothetical protein
LLENLEHYEKTALIVLIQAGAAALGYINQSEILLHKALKTYMVRKKQGKSQLKHLKTKGKSRLGSRIRLKNADHFFEDISEKLNEWKNEVSNSGSIILACPVSLQHMFFNPDLPLPFGKEDKRIVKTPFDVNVPDFSELKRIHYLTRCGRIWYDIKRLSPENETIIDQFFKDHRYF